MSNAAATPVTYGLDAAMARFSVPRYQRMIEAGILTSEDKVELLENCVVLKMPRNPRHDGTIDLLMDRMRVSLPVGWRLRVQQTLVLSDSQPEPDLTIVRGDARSFMVRHPLATDLGVVIEVADSSLLRDQRDKARIYARGGVPCYWIVNLVDHRIEVHTQPSGPCESPKYDEVRHFSPGDNVPLILDGRTVGEIPASELLP
jgi:Uma2 family endonuclease